MARLVHLCEALEDGLRMVDELLASGGATCRGGRTIDAMGMAGARPEEMETVSLSPADDDDVSEITNKDGENSGRG